VSELDDGPRANLNAALGSENEAIPGGERVALGAQGVRQ
jgi:hypothetical protein